LLLPVAFWSLWDATGRDFSVATQED